MAYDKKKLAAGVKEMRSVAKRLTTWADDLEKLLTSNEPEVNEDADCMAVPAVAASLPDSAPVVGGDSAEAVKQAAPEEAPVNPTKVPVHSTEASAAPAKAPAVPAKASVAPVKAPTAKPTLAEVKNFLTKLCAAGYAPQVKALIASYGVSSLSAVPAEALGELMDAARQLGGGENAQ